jgi:hypothetical protein
MPTLASAIHPNLYYVFCADRRGTRWRIEQLKHGRTFGKNNPDNADANARNQVNEDWCPLRY